MIVFYIVSHNHNIEFYKNNYLKILTYKEKYDYIQNMRKISKSRVSE